MILFFSLSNDLKSGGVVYFSGRKWLKEIEKAKKIKRDEIEKYEKDCKKI